MKYKSILPFLAIVLSGCGATYTSVKEGPTLLNSVAKTKEFKFLKPNQELASQLTEREIILAVKNEISERAPFSGCRTLCTERKNYNAPLEKWGRQVALDHKNNAINLTLINGEEYKNTDISSNVTRNFKSTSVTATFNYEVEENSENFVFKLYPANTINIVPGKNPVFMTYKPLMSGAKLESRLVKLFEEITPTIDKTIIETGEFDVDFDPASVKTNFTRKLESWSGPSVETTTKTQYDESFKLQKDGVVAKVDLQIYLYRGKSKVEYRISYPYQIMFDGSSTIPSSSTMEQFVKHVQNIANS